MQARCKGCPNVVRFKEYFICEGFNCIVMENMAGGDLQQYIASRDFEPVPMAMARSILKQIC